MLNKWVVFTGLLLVFAINSGDGFAAATDNDSRNSPDVNVIWNWDSYNGVNADYNIDDRLYAGFDWNFSWDEQESRYDRNFNVTDDLGYDRDKLVDDRADLFDVYDRTAANVDGDIK